MCLAVKKKEFFVCVAHGSRYTFGIIVPSPNRWVLAVMRYNTIRSRCVFFFLKKNKDLRRLPVLKVTVGQGMHMGYDLGKLRCSNSNYRQKKKKDSQLRILEDPVTYVSTNTAYLSI